MPWVGFESTIPAFEQAKTVYVLDRAAIVMGHEVVYPLQTHFKSR
jgi:hypothetical protein